MQIEIVTDSTSDIPPDVADEYHIHIVPAILNIGGKSVEDGPGISRREFYERLPAMQPLPTTSAPSVGSFLRLYEKVFQQGADKILSLHAPAPLSGIYNAARLAAQNFGERVHVVDSGSLTLGLGFQAMAASEASQNGASLDEVITHVEDVRKRINLIAMLDTFEYVRRSIGHFVEYQTVYWRKRWGSHAVGRNPHSPERNSKVGRDAVESRPDRSPGYPSYQYRRRSPPILVFPEYELTHFTTDRECHYGDRHPRRAKRFGVCGRSALG
jgi:hypothetical protein